VSPEGCPRTPDCTGTVTAFLGRDLHRHLADDPAQMRRSEAMRIAKRRNV
jgi:hypothetical protein